VELHDAEPGVDGKWEDVVEASCTPLSGKVTLVEWGYQASYPLALTARSYRVRYCATGMDEGSKGLPRVDGEPVTDWYLLQFWPAEPSRDAVVRQSSAAAHYFHSTWGGECPGCQQGR
jgi:hypothetical protein